jgi:hypothetical protein
MMKLTMSAELFPKETLRECGNETDFDNQADDSLKGC